MENTRENEMRFKALYLYANVLQGRMITIEGGKDIYLPLIPEDLAEERYADKTKPLAVKEITSMEEVEKAAAQMTDGPMDSFKMVDYLRSEGYAFYWMGVTVEEQIKRNWIKIRK